MTAAMQHARGHVMTCQGPCDIRTTFAKVPDQRRTASRALALHRVRDTRLQRCNEQNPGGCPGLWISLAL
jgi:hypothetical protein